MEKLKTAENYIKSSSDVMCGFNQFIYGSGEPRRSDYGSSSQWYAEQKGYNYAKKMAKEKGIAFTHVFKCGNSESCHPFSYGGFFVCNSCGNKIIIIQCTPFHDYTVKMERKFDNDSICTEKTFRYGVVNV